VICFFTASKGGHGPAEVSLGLFKSIKGDKKSKLLFNSACRLLGLFNIDKDEWESFKRLNTNRSSLDTKAPYVGWKTDYKDEDKKDVSLFDNIIDLLYNLFQPISILVIAGLMYVFIRFTTSGNTVAGAAAPAV
jgi:hypothetical protein